MKKIYWLSLLVGIVLVLIYAFESYYIDFMRLFSHVFSSSIAGASVAASISAWKKYWEG